MSYYSKNLKPSEVIISVIKKYFLTFFAQGFISIILLLLPFFLLYLLFQLNRWGLVIFGILFFIGLICFIRFIVNYYFNNLIITNQRLIYYQQKGLFHRVVFETQLGKIQDISYEINGMKQTVFKYGSLKVQIINSNTIIIIDRIKNPEAIQNLINRTIENLNYTKKAELDNDGLENIIDNLKNKFGKDKIQDYLLKNESEE